MRRRALDRRSFYELGCVTIFLELLWIGSQFPTQAQEEFLFIPQSALYPGGISADPFFLPLEEARQGTPLPRNDDDSTDPIDLGFVFRFYGETFTAIINNNGNISFAEALWEYDPVPFPSANPRYRMIAPYWADVDTEEYVPGPEEEFTNLVYYTQRTYNGLKQFVVTWDGVTGYGLDSTLRATFQLVLQEDGRVGFAWDAVEWELGTASETYAVVGFNAGDGVQGGMLEGSAEPGISQVVSFHRLYFQSDAEGRLHLAFPISPRWDVNRDGVVDITDIVLVLQALGTFGDRAPEDVTGDGVINAHDLVVVVNHFGEVYGGGPNTAPALQVEANRPLLVQALREIRLENDGSPEFRQAIRVLESLLAHVLPTRTALLPNFPNPFNPETWIPFTLGEEAEVRLSVYAADGSLVRKIDLGRLTPGFYTDRRRAAYWDGRNALGEPVASGAYFVIFQAGSVTQTRRLLLMK